MAQPYAPAPAPTPERKLPVVGLLIAGGVLLLALLVGGGVFAYNTVFQRPNAIPQLLAADTQLYIAVTPNLSDVPNLDRLRRAFPTEDDAPLDEDLSKQLEEQLGVSFQADIAPWIGPEAAFALTNFPVDAIASAGDLGATDLPNATDALFILSSRDDRAAQTFLDKQRAHREGKGETFTSTEVQGVTVYSQEGDEKTPLSSFAIVRRHVVFATSPDLIGAIAARDPRGEATLERNPRFQEVRAALPENRLGYLYLDAAPLVQLVEASSEDLGDVMPAEQLEQQLAAMRAMKGMGFSLAAEADGFAFDAVVGMDRAKVPAELMSQIDEYREAVSPERITVVSSDALAAVSFRIPPSFGKTMRDSFAAVPDAEEQIAAFEQELDFDLDRDFFSWFHGEASLVLLPGETILDSETPVTGYFALRPTDKAAAEAGMAKLVTVLESAAGDLGLREEQVGGATWQVIGPPEQAVGGYGFIGDELVVGVGPRAMAAATGEGEALGGQADFQMVTKPLPAPNGGVFFANLGPLLDLAEEQGADPEAIDGLRPFTAIAAAGTPGLDEKGMSHGRLFITVAPAP